MCGNFGLLLFNKSQVVQEKNDVFKPKKPIDDLDRSLDRSMHMVSEVHGLRMDNNVTTNSPLLEPINILKSQTAATEIRGGQAGGYSSLIYNQVEAKSLYESQFNQVASYEEPIITRVRHVARKRHPLASDLSEIYKKENKSSIKPNALISVIGHTRFATSSINEVNELHPHEWTPCHNVSIWQFNRQIDGFECKELNFGIHITHNGDFDAFDCYSQSVENKDLGLWLERVLHYPNNLKGDSPKIAGCLELLRVQGSWFAASRLAWVRCVLASVNDVSGNKEISKSSPNTFPHNSFFMKWGRYIDIFWKQHINNVIVSNYLSNNETKDKSTYSINRKAEKLLVQEIINSLTGFGSVPFFENNQMENTLDILKERLISLNLSIHSSLNGKQISKHSYEQQIPTNSLFRIKRALGIDLWSTKTIRSFVTTCVYHFLRADLYNAMTELMARATGSFGIQAHCTIEPGVVVIASKGQPMSIAFDPYRPICLFASEAEALAVPIDTSNNWLSERIDLDSHGEIMRIGQPRALNEGNYIHSTNAQPIHQIPAKFQSTYLSNIPSNRLSKKNPELSLSSDALNLLSENYDYDSSDVKSKIEQKYKIIENKSNKISGRYVTSYLPKPEYLIKSDALNLLNDRLSVHEKFSSHSKHSARHSYTSTRQSFDLLTRDIASSTVSLPNQPAILPSDYQSTNPTIVQNSNTSNYLSTQTKLQLQNGIEIRSYSLSQRCECNLSTLLDRCVTITTSSPPYDPTIDLVAEDLKVTPAVLHMINTAWDNSSSIERIAAKSLASCLNHCMSTRLSTESESIDLLIGGVEVSLWIAEQWASDLRAIFPQLKVVTVSANKLLGLGNENPQKVFFPGSDVIHPSQIDKNTCALLISQSGQTFPTLHATKVLCKLLGERLWLLTGCFNSKMEQILIESYNDRQADSDISDDSMKYKKDRVFNNYSGHRPAEPSSVAVASTWHTLTRLLLEIVNETRLKYPGSCILHPWQYSTYAKKIQRFFKSIVSNRLIYRTKYLSEKSLYLSKKSIPMIDKNKSNSNILMLLSDGCINDMKSLIGNVASNISYIVGYDINQKQLLLCNTNDNENKPRSAYNLISNISPENKFSTKQTSYVYLPHTKLVAQGKAWADHINEPWNMLVLAGVYICLSVGLGLPIFGLIADAILAIIRASGVTSIGNGVLEFTPRVAHNVRDQNFGYSLIGLVIQLMDAFFFIYISKNLTYLSRFICKRPLWARHGRRTIVIVDNPTIHQLVEIFVSKLYAQSYSIVGVDVHGASGMDHFVHRFTHRVVRGLLIAVGRPDGRLTCLAKSESAVLLSTKQAAFIRNPDYYGKYSGSEGSGPEIVTIGHSPYTPFLGVSHHIQLEAIDNDFIVHRRKEFLDEYLFNRLYLATKPFTLPIIKSFAKYLNNKINRNISYKSNSKTIQKLDSQIGSFGLDSILFQDESNNQSDIIDNDMIDLPYGIHHINPSLGLNNTTNPMLLDLIIQSKDLLKNRKIDKKNSDISIKIDNRTDSKTNIKVDRKISNMTINKMDGQIDNNVGSNSNKNSDPNTRLAFISKLDSQTKNLIDLQVIVQQFYECRIASLERYLSFCVMFHSMAKHTCEPWLRHPWDIARSQSNLRVATTAAPVGSQSEEGDEISKETKLMLKSFIAKLRGYDMNF